MFFYNFQSKTSVSVADSERLIRLPSTPLMMKDIRVMIDMTGDRLDFVLLDMPCSISGSSSRTRVDLHPS